MSDFLARVSDFVQKVAAGPLLQPQALILPPERCLPAGDSGATILKDKCYLVLTINELFLAKARKWMVEYQPMLVVLTSFIYGNAPITVPAVVGPSLLADAKQKSIPRDLLLNDIPVAGPVPYRGGNVTISVLLYRVKYRDYAPALLHLVEGLSKAIGPTADLGLLSKVGEPLLAGLETLLGLGDTEPVMGQRFTMSPVGPGGIRTFSSALLGPDAVSGRALSVDSGRLYAGSGKDVARYSETDYVLYSLSAPPRRTDERTLPFYALYLRAMQDASRRGEENWKAAKATLSEAWQQMMVSPDLIPEQAEELLEEWKRKLLTEKERGNRNRALSARNERTTSDVRTQGAAAILDL